MPPRDSYTYPLVDGKFTNWHALATSAPGKAIQAELIRLYAGSIQSIIGLPGVTVTTRGNNNLIINGSVKDLQAAKFTLDRLAKERKVSPLLLDVQTIDADGKPVAPHISVPVAGIYAYGQKLPKADTMGYIRAIAAADGILPPLPATPKLTGPPASTPGGKPGGTTAPDPAMLPEENNPFAKQYNDWLKAARKALDKVTHPTAKAQTAELYQNLLGIHYQAAQTYDSWLKTNPAFAAAQQNTLQMQVAESVRQTVLMADAYPRPGNVIRANIAYSNLQGELTGGLLGAVTKPFYDREAAEKSGSMFGGLKLGGIIGFLVGIFASGSFFPKKQGEPKGIMDRVQEWGIRLMVGLGFAFGGNKIQEWVAQKSGGTTTPTGGTPPAGGGGYPAGSPLPYGAPPPATGGGLRPGR